MPAFVRVTMNLLSVNQSAHRWLNVSGTQVVDNWLEQVSFNLHLLGKKRVFPRSTVGLKTKTHFSKSLLKFRGMACMNLKTCANSRMPCSLIYTTVTWRWPVVYCVKNLVAVNEVCHIWGLSSITNTACLSSTQLSLFRDASASSLTSPQPPVSNVESVSMSSDYSSYSIQCGLW